MMMLMMVAAETEVTFNEDRDVACTPSTAVTSSVDDCNVNTSHVTSQSALEDRNDLNSLTAGLVLWHLTVSFCGRSSE